MKKLTLYRLEPVDHLVKPREFSDLNEQSPASTLVKDFRSYQPHTVYANTSAVEVARLMAMEGVTAKLVVNKDRELVGLITEERLYERCILVAQTAQGVDRHELTVADMMRPRAVIPALDYETLKYATVIDLVNTLREAGEEYCLVLDRTQHHIRGLISVADIAERLHQPVVVKPKSSIARTIEL